MIPMQVLADIDNSRNPMFLTKERIERAATENQFMNGKIHAINVILFLTFYLLATANVHISPISSHTVRCWMTRSFKTSLS